MKGWTDRSSFEPKSAADRGRDDAHLRRRDAENFRDVVAIHVGRLRAGLDFDAIADASGKAGFRLDIGVLDEAGLEGALDDEIRGRQARRDVAARDAPAGQDIAGAASVDPLRFGRERLVERRQRGSNFP